jgi:Raf kinase inhibitor-like YbhB/YbcL family protein
VIRRGTVAALSLMLVAATGGEAVPFAIESPSFEDGEEIPTRFTCEGADVSPELRWSNPPEGTRSFALIVDDPDAPDPRAPKTTWVHWVLYNLPAEARGIREAATADGLPPGTLQGRNGWKRVGYGGPCPPVGRHRYFHKLFALDAQLENLEEPGAADLERAMEGHVLGRVELIGTYRKQRP